MCNTYSALIFLLLTCKLGVGQHDDDDDDGMMTVEFSITVFCTSRCVLSAADI